jgi:hypothetical protein
MAKYTAIQDKDLGMSEIMYNIAALSKMAVKAGIVESEGKKNEKKRVRVTGKSGKPLKKKKVVESTETPTIAQVAAWNEYGVMGPPVSENGDGKWFIPPRPFIRGWTDNKAENIKATQEKIVKKVTEGKWTADDAVMRLGEFAQDGIKSYIRTGAFKQNADRTKKQKKSSKPLIDTGTMRNSVRYEVVKK